MHYRVLWDLRRVEEKLEAICQEYSLGTYELERIRSFRLYLEQVDPEVYAELHPLVHEITEVVELGLSGSPEDYEKSLFLLEATALANNLDMGEDEAPPDELPPDAAPPDEA